jgi:hypothetical protein
MLIEFEADRCFWRSFTCIYTCRYIRDLEYMKQDYADNDEFFFPKAEPKINSIKICGSKIYKTPAPILQEQSNDSSKKNRVY